MQMVYIKRFLFHTFSTFPSTFSELSLFAKSFYGVSTGSLNYTAFYIYENTGQMWLSSGMYLSLYFFKNSRKLIYQKQFVLWIALLALSSDTTH